MSNILGSGRPDPHFADNGLLRFAVPSGFRGHSKVLPDDTYISIGSTTPDLIADSIAILRHDIAGKPIGNVATLQLIRDTSFVLRNLLVQANRSVVIFGALEGNKTLFARVLPDNTLDRSFGTNGFTIFSLKDDYSPGDRHDRSGMVARNDGSIAVAIELKIGGNNDGGALFSIDESGRPENDFGDEGVTYSEGESSFQGLAARPDGKLLVVGRRDKGGLVALFTRDGAPDKTYDQYGNGYVLIDGTGAYHVELVAISEAQGEKTLVSGYLLKGQNGTPVFPSIALVARLESDGSLDKTFNNGQSLEIKSDVSQIARGLAVQSDTSKDSSSSTRAIRKILVWIPENIASTGAILRLDDTGKPDLTFGPEGMFYVDTGDYQNGFEQLSNTKAAIYGSSTEGTTGAIARFLTQ
ncbi:hypothetical protein ACYZT8_25980 [Pseudomonas sp. LB3P93]